MSRSLFSRLILVTLTALTATMGVAQVPSDIMYNTTSAPSSGRLLFGSGFTYRQKFPSLIAGYPTELGVNMGIYQNLMTRTS